MHVRWESDGTITADGRAIAQIDKSFWRERADVVIDGEPWVFRKGWGTLIAETNGVERFVAAKQGFFSSAWAIEGASEVALEIRRAGLFSSGYTIIAQGQVAAEVRKGSFFTSRTATDLPDAVPLAEAVFVLWVVFILIRRNSQAAANSSN